MKNAILLTDGYKLDHRRQYPEGTEYGHITNNITFDEIRKNICKNLI